MALRTRRYPNERVLVLAGLGVASALCIGLELLRELRFDAPGYRFLLWNLALAWVPLVVALVIYDRYRRGTSLSRLAPAAALWLIFLPNAPYILTDFIHLSPSRHTPLWLDGTILSAFAWTGLLLGFVSLYLLHAVARDRYGSRTSWYCVVSVLALVSAGVCLGRFLRWNSWDLLVQPGKLLAQLLPHLGDPGAVARATLLTLLLTCLLAAAYFSFYAVVGIRLNPDGERRR